MLVVISHAIDDFSGSPEAENACENFRAAFEQRGFGRIREPVVVTPCLEMFGNDGFDVIDLNSGRRTNASVDDDGRFIFLRVEVERGGTSPESGLDVFKFHGDYLLCEKQWERPTAGRPRNMTCHCWTEMSLIAARFVSS